MSIATIKNWLVKHPKLRQWLWFVTLWCVGLLTVTALSLPIKLLIRSISSS